MSENLNIWEYEQHEIRTIEKDGEPWFVGKDVADILGYQNGSRDINRHVDDEDKMTERIVLSGQNREMIFINESGLYSLILSSKLPTAKKFKRWVTNEVLPSIRKHGAYMNEQTLEQALTSPDFLIRLAQQLKAEKEKNAALESKIAEDAPKVEFANAVAESSSLIDIGTLAKLARDENIPIGRNRLFDWLRQHKYIMDKEHKYEPYQTWLDRGIFVAKEYSYRTAYGYETQTKILVTGKGQIYLIEKLRSEFCKKENAAVVNQ